MADSVYSITMKKQTKDPQAKYPKRLPISDAQHEAILEIRRTTGKSIYVIARELIDLALKVKRIPVKGEVS